MPMPWLLVVAALAEPSPASAAHPFAPAPSQVRTIDGSYAARTPASVQPARATPAFSDLDAYRSDDPPAVHEPGRLPEGWVQRGEHVMPHDIADGLQIPPDVTFAVEDFPGNEYPRKHTLYLNFVGGDLYIGADNSALSKSQLSKGGAYPAFTGGEQVATSAAQQMANDVAAFGIRVVYDERPDPIVPYTMAMIGGHWTDTNIEDSASGVAPGTDCGALGQRHVVYVFASGGWSSTQIANVTAQEAGHAWGLDHSVNCNSVMSYCGGGDKSFSGTCDSLCEAACQGPAGCRLFHEQFCGVGNDRQNEAAELAFLFGDDAPDLQAPTVEIVSPTDGEVVAPGADIKLRALVDDDYGGYAWKFVVTHDGEVIHDEIDFKKQVDSEYRPALNIVNLELGTWTFTVQAADHYDHVTTQTVTVHVEPPATGDDEDDDGATPPDPPSGSDDAGDDPPIDADDDGDSDDADGEDAGVGIDDPSAPMGSENDGCGCRSAGPSRGLALWLPVGLWLRRRRSATRLTSARSAARFADGPVSPRPRR